MVAPPALVSEHFLDNGMVGVIRLHFGRLESGLRGCGGFWVVLGGVGWALAELVSLDPKHYLLTCFSQNGDGADRVVTMTRTASSSSSSSTSTSS